MITDMYSGDGQGRIEFARNMIPVKTNPQHKPAISGNTKKMTYIWLRIPTTMPGDGQTIFNNEKCRDVRSYASVEGLRLRLKIE